MKKGLEGMTQKGGHKRPTDQGAGLTQKGVEKYRRQNPGSKLQTAVTTPPSKLKLVQSQETVISVEQRLDRRSVARSEETLESRRGWTGAKPPLVLTSMREVYIQLMRSLGKGTPRC